MDEHTLQTKIGNTQAHLTALKIEVESVNAKLSDALSSLTSTEDRRVAASEELVGVEKQLTLARGALRQTHVDIAETVRLAHEERLQAQKLFSEAEAALAQARDEAGKIVGTARTDEAVLKAYIEILSTEKAKAEEVVIALDNLIADRMREADDKSARLNQTAEAITVSDALLTEVKEKLKNRVKEVESASEALVRTRAENADLIAGIKRRDVQLRVKEEDAEILRQRLRFIIEEQYKILKNGHLGTQ